MSLQWNPGDLRAFHRREAALTHSQTLARRGLLGLLIVCFILLVLFGCAGNKPIPSEKGYALMRFDAAGLKPNGCQYEHAEEGDFDRFSYYCSFIAEDGTRWSVSKTWYRNRVR